MFIYLKNGQRRELPQAMFASEDDIHVILFDRGRQEIGRIERANIEAYSRWPIDSDGIPVPVAVTKQ